jgi:hypothetical protein
MTKMYSGKNLRIYYKTCIKYLTVWNCEEIKQLAETKMIAYWRYKEIKATE